MPKLTHKQKTMTAKRAVAESKAKGSQTTALKTLTPIAKDINTRLDKAAKMENDAYDHRLAAAIRLNDAHKIIKKTKGMTIKVWCESNIELSYSNVKHLTKVGAAKNPRLALEDLRVKNKLANAALRDRVAKAKAKQPAVKKITASGKKPPKLSVGERVEAALTSTDTQHAVKIIEVAAEQRSLAVVTLDEAKAARRAAQLQKMSTVGRIKQMLSASRGSEQMEVLSWLAGEVGVALPDTFTVPEVAPTSDEDLTDIPDFLRRDTKKKGSRRKAA